MALGNCMWKYRDCTFTYASKNKMFRGREEWLVEAKQCISDGFHGDFRLKRIKIHQKTYI